MNAIGEIIAKVVSSNYVPRHKWEMHREDNCDTDYERIEMYYLEKDSLAFHNKTVYADQNNILNIQLQKYKLYNLVIDYEVDDYNKDVVDKILNDTIAMRFGNNTLCDISVYVNLLVAKLLGKEVVLNDYTISVPVIIFDLMTQRGFPLYALEPPFTPYGTSLKNDLNLNFSCNKKYKSLNFDYTEVAEINENIMLMFPSIISENIGTYSTKHRMLPHFRGVCKLAIFSIEEDDDLIETPLIQQIDIFMNSQGLLSYNADDGEIIQYELFGKMYYIISFSPNYKTESDLRKILIKEQIFVTQKNYLDHQMGINFSRVDHVEIKIKLDRECDANVKISTLRNNSLIFSEGTCILRYAS